jgi:hypothetical protein
MIEFRAYLNTAPSRKIRLRRRRHLERPNTIESHRRSNSKPTAMLYTANRLCIVRRLDSVSNKESLQPSTNHSKHMQVPPTN